MEKVNISAEKRGFDVLFSLALALILSPLILLILFAMLVENIFIAASRGGIFYTETRISEGKPFKIYKFRIFKNAVLREKMETGQFVHTKNLEKDKNNLTYTGRFLKQIYMDEFPQLINVLRGEMSLVGPRPVNAVDYEALVKNGDYNRMVIRAGITGKFQIYKGEKRGLSQREADAYYIKFCRENPGWLVVLYDIKILLLTVITVLRAEGI